MAGESLTFDIFWRDHGTDTGFRALSKAAKDAAGNIGDVAGKLDKVSGRVAKATIDLKGNKEASAQLELITAKLIRLGRILAKPGIKPEGVARTLADISAINLALDKLDKRSAGTGILGLVGKIPRVGPGISSVLSLGGGAGGSAAGAAGTGIGGSGITALGGTLGAGGGIAALLASLYLIPHAAAAAGSALIFALGGAMTFIGVQAALKNRLVAASFHDLGKQISTDLGQAAIPFRAVLINIATALKGSLPTVMLSLAIAFRAIAPALQLFGVTIARTLGDPTVQASIRAIGVAFASLLKAITPSIPSMINQIADGITGIAQAVTKNPQTFAILIDFFIHLIGWGLQAVGALIRVAGWTDRFAVAVGSAFLGAWHAVDGAIHNINAAIAGFGIIVATVFDKVRHAIATIGHDIATAFDDVRHAIATVGHDIATAFDLVRHAQGQFDAFGKDISAVRHTVLAAMDDMRHGIAVVFDGIRHDVAAAWDALWRNTTAVLARLRHDIAASWNAIWRSTIASVRNGITSVIGFFQALPGRVGRALAGLGHQLWQEGSFILGQFLDGLKSVAGAIFSWIGNFVSTIWDKVKRFFGMSPPHPGSKFYDLGRDMMLHLEAGIQAHAHRAAAAAQKAANRIPPQTGALSGNAALAQSFAASILPRGWSFPALLNLWNQESGWNAYAVNPSSGAYGIPQSLGHGHPYALGDYKAQIVWGLNYIAGRYGTSQAAWAHEQAFNWYDQGGWLPRGVSIAVNRTGRPERILSPHQSGGGSRTVLELRGGHSQYGQFLVNEIRRLVRDQGGGDVQVAFGTS